MRVGVLASGSGTNLQALLDACRDSATARVALVASHRAEAPVLERARAAGVATAVIPDPDDGAGITALLRQYEIDLVVLAGYVKLVPAATVRAFADRMINIHPALLPSFGGPGMYGRRVHQAVLAAGATVSGATVHLVTAEYDRGPIVAQWPVPVAPDDTVESLAARVLAVEHQLLPAVVLAAGLTGRVTRLVPAAGHFQVSEGSLPLARMLVAPEPA
jgi:formyltetrahydrofolate-dependent phosphoribosylglycinamide formyltransferase